MLGSELFGNTNLRTWVRGVFRASALCGVFAMVMLTAGCPGPATPCTDAASCDDNNGCTTDTCNADGTCSNVDDCDEDHCIVITNASGDQAAVLGCVECIPSMEAEDCDDNDACTTDTCSTEAATLGQCVNTAADCNDDDACTTDACDAATGACSNTAIDCDDADACTDDSCDPATGCVNTETEVAAGCDNGDFCDGTEACDPATGECVAGTDPCTEDQACDEDTDMCLDGTPCDDDADCPDDGDFCNGTESCGDDGFCASSGDPCTAPATCDEDVDACLGGACDDDTDCDDGNFCNGTETCDVALMVCIAGTDPCTATQTCDEATDTCQDPTGETLDFTLNIDNLTGTDAADMFIAAVALSNGVQTPTLGIGDSANGGASADSMTATLVGTNGTISATISAIETFNFTDFSSAGSWTITGATITGLEEINSINSLNTNPLIFTNLGSVVDVGLTNTNAGMTLNYTSTATMGAMDSMALNLSNVQGGTLTVVSANTNGIESLAVDSSGVANTLAAITQTTGNTLTSMSVTGSQNLTITGALPSTVATVNAMNATGAVNVNVTANTGTLALTGGSGDDTFTVGANYTSADVVNGGAGTGDALGIDSAAAAAATTAQTNATNLEAITITNGLAGAFTPANFSGVVTTNLSTGFNGGSITAVTGHTITSGTRAADSDSAGAGTVTVNGGGIADAINFTINDSDQMANTFTGVEVLNIASNNDLDGTAADGGANTGTTLTVTQSVGGTATVNITGAANLTFTGAVTASTINASTFTGNLTMSATSVGATSITGGSGNDTIFGTAGADTALIGGAGNDQFFGQAGADNITTGAGNDIISMVFADVADVITDFTPGSDKFDYNTALLSIDGTVTAPGATGAFQSAAAGTALAATTVVFELTGTTVATQSAANVVTALGATATNAAIDAADRMLIIAYTTGGGGAIYDFLDASGADIAAGELTLVATFTTLTADSLGAGDFQ